MSGNGTPTSDLLLPRWLQRWALLTLAATVVQVVLGAVVTTFRVGMADPVWPTLPWHLFLISWDEPSRGYLIEHAHRLWGHLVGCCVILLALWLWLGELVAFLRHRDGRRLLLLGLGLLALTAMIVSLSLDFRYIDRSTRPFTSAEAWLCLLCPALCLAVIGFFLVVAVYLRDRGFWLTWLGTVALAGVMMQGLLGGFRVKLNATVGVDLALIHGSFAQVLFALLAALALLTSPRWTASSATGPLAPGWLRGWSALTAGLVSLQLVLGAWVRHTNSAQWGRAHLLTAFAVTAAVAVLVKLVLDNKRESGRASAAVLFLAALVAVQLLLGVEAWMSKFSSGELPELVQVTIPQAILRTAHVLVGSWILATAVVVALQVRQRSPLAVHDAKAPPQPLEGAA